MAEVKQILNAAESKMDGAIDHLDESLAHIRAGKANPRILDGIFVEYYGSSVPLSNVANISTPDAKTIAITPWEKQCSAKLRRQLSTPSWASCLKTTAKSSA